MTLSHQAKLSLWLHALVSFGASISFIFINIYIWRLSHEFQIIGVYNLILFIFTPLAFVAGGYVAKRRDRALVVRLGVYCYVAYFLLILIAREQVIDYYMLFGALSGFALGMYWCGILNLMYDLTTPDNRLRYMGLSNIAMTVTSLLGPLLAGAIISRTYGLTGYIIVFCITFVIFLAGVVLSYRLKPAAPRRTRFYLSYTWLMAKRHKTWGKAVAAYAVFGTFEGFMYFLPGLLMYHAFPNEGQVSYFLVLFSALSISVSYLMSKYMKITVIYKIMALYMTALVAGSGMLLVQANAYTVPVFLAVYSCVNPLMNSMILSYYFNLVGRLPLRGEFRVESIIIYETAMNFGRCVVIIGMLVLHVQPGTPSLAQFLLPVALLQALMFLFIQKKQVAVEAV